MNSITKNSSKLKSEDAVLSSDFVTVLTVAGRGNKLVTRENDGKVKKDAGPPISEAVAQTVHVKTRKAMTRLQRKISKKTNKVIILGFIPGTEPDGNEHAGEPYKIVSQKIMDKAIGVDHETPEGYEAVLGWHEVNGEKSICRLKSNFAPSSWCLLDIDAVRGMPDHLASMDSDDRLDALADVIPSFEKAGVVIVPSTTGRVLVDGEPMDATGEHFYIQLKDANDLERFGAVLLQRSLLSGNGFMRPRYSKLEPEKIISYGPWGIADPTTFSWERLVYDGSPTVRGKGLEIADAKFKVFKGGRLDTSLMPDLTDDEAVAYAEMTGQRIKKALQTENVMGADGQIIARQVYRFGAVDDRLLKMDTQIETNAGVMTVEEYWKGDKGKLRCQTPFRESSSENGILNRHKDGTPFVYDNGIRVRYVLPPELVRKHRADIYMGRLALLKSDEIKKVWTDGLRRMEPTEHEKVRQRVHNLTEVGIKELSAELKSAKNLWKAEDIKAANERLKAEIKDSGKTAIMVDSIDLDEVVQQVEKTLFNDKIGTPVMSHGDRLVCVRMMKPTTVREVRRERNAGHDEVPLTMMVDQFQFYALMARLSQCFNFIKVTESAWIEVPPPNGVIRAMLEHSHKRAPALVGIIEHPVMGQNGELLIAEGLSADGLFVQISKDLIPTLAGTITSKMAHKSLRWIIDKALADFPFATDIDVAGAIAALLTAIQRRMFDSNEGCPGFLTTAPIQSSGKTAFFQLLFEIVWGKTAAATNWSSSDEELGKHILAILLEGHGGVLFDNLEEGGRIESNALARAMTSPKFTGRVLTENRQATVPTNCLWCFTGNNISASGDFNTRILPISIDPGVENPDQRSYSRSDLAEWCESHRAEFYKHAMTILIGYQRHLIAGGAPCSVRPTRYGNWDKQVRHAMIWAGSADPALLFEQNKAEDPKREGRRNFLASWYEVYGRTPKYLRDVINETRNFSAHAGTNKGDHLQNMDEAIRDLLPNGKVTSRSLGTVIRKFAGQWIDGYRVVAEGGDLKSHKSKPWTAEKKEG
jgi:hypothetical protein